MTTSPLSLTSIEESSTTSSAQKQEETKNIDWRYAMFGGHIRLNPQTPKIPIESKTISGNDSDDIEVESFSSLISYDEESAVFPLASYVPTKEAFDTDKYDYIAIFIGANYCPSCKSFAPHVVKSAVDLEQKKRCKVIFVSCDRDEKNFEISCKKTKGIDVMPYDLEKAKSIRDTFGLSTIPALMVVRNANPASTNEEAPEVIVNARHILETDPDLTSVLGWESYDVENNSSKNSNSTNYSPLKVQYNHHDVYSTKLSLRDMLIIPKKYGKNWWQLGHCINPSRPDKMYMDENAVRIRAGILNIISWISLISIISWRVTDILTYAVFPIVMFEMVSSMIIGLAPVAPIGTLATIMAHFFFPTPQWKPAEPKRFAWFIGSVMVINCIIANLLPLGESITFPWKTTVVLMCNIFTWLESSCGFCFGCFVYNNLVTKVFTSLEDCEECKI